MNRTKRRRNHTGSDVAQDKKVRNPPQSHAGSHISLGPQINLLSLNVEGLSLAKCEYLTNLLSENSIDVLFLQETHVESNSEPSKYRIPNYTAVDILYHKKYGTMVFSKYPQQTTILHSSQSENNIHQTIVQLGETTLINIYKPPQEQWPSPPLPKIYHPTVITGDFNSHHSDWGYKSNNKAGEDLSTWASQNDVHLVFDPREKGTFFSARWQKDYSTDLTFISKDINDNPLHSNRKILNNFPKSQHRPVLITIGITIPITPSLPKPRWNFRKANWNAFTEYIEKICERIPPKQCNFNRFTKLILSSAKKHIPRGHRSTYIPCWTETSQALLEKYEETQDPDTADELLQSLYEGRCNKWKETVEKLDFKHSSRQAWNLLKKLNPDKNPKTTQACPINIEAIANQIKQRSTHKPNHAFEKEIRRSYQQQYKSCSPCGFPAIPVKNQEITTAIKQMKAGKAAGMDGIYPDMIKHLGPKATTWLASSFSHIIETSKYPQVWKEAKILAILKPGKPPDDPSSYRPISLLCCFFKLLERVILTRIMPFLDPYIPIEQAGFRSGRDTTEQALALTTYIETGYEKKLKTGAVFIDLSAAYDTVWHDGLMYKLSKVINCKTTLKLINKMSGRRTYHVCLGNSTSKKRIIKNGVPQGSVLAPTLFNIYIHDMPKTESLRLGYADDFVVAHQSTNVNNIESTLSQDTTLLQSFFDKWYLKMNTSKTVSTLFHLDNHKANQQLAIDINDSTLPYEPNPKYLGVTLDRTLSYKQHLENTANKLRKRNGIIRKIAGTSWGASPAVLRTSSLALSYSVAEYCAPVWARSSHTNKIDTLLNDTMRIISGTLKSTPTSWLPVMSAIEPSHLRRESAVQKYLQKLTNTIPETPINEIIRSAPKTHRLKSRKPIYNTQSENFNMEDAWREEWALKPPKGSEIIEDPTAIPLPGFNNLKRRDWTTINRIRSRHGRTASNQHKWGFSNTTNCPECNHPYHNMDHVILNCPKTSVPGGYEKIHQADETFLTWMKNNNVEL